MTQGSATSPRPRATSLAHADSSVGLFFVLAGVADRVVYFPRHAARPASRFGTHLNPKRTITRGRAEAFASVFIHPGPFFLPRAQPKRNL